MHDVEENCGAGGKILPTLPGESAPTLERIRLQTAAHDSSNTALGDDDDDEDEDEDEDEHDDDNDNDANATADTPATVSCFPLIQPANSHRRQ